MICMSTGVLLLLISSCKPTDTQPCECDRFRLPALSTDFQGIPSKKLTGRAAGLPLDSMPGIQTISTQKLERLQEAPKTGLYLVDTDFIPQELAKELKEAGYRLSPDGTLDSAGVPIALFVQAEVFSLQTDSNASNQSFYDLTNPAPKTRAFPLPWAGYSYSFWWKYNGGFCRSFEGRSRAYAYGPPTGDFWPYTNVQWMQTHVRARNAQDTDVCANCFSESSYAKNSIGCFWPAFGGNSTGYHYIYIYDSGASVFTSWGWTH